MQQNIIFLKICLYIFLPWTVIQRQLEKSYMMQ